ncbi:hypothetical protein AKJ45_00615 [candidate division MSBL1 archaeon SCGC-AAA261F19]|uniref:acetate--CoA ligase (ADP-forming) n=1 Tax=candidate division MSBL1 archaeon SCGC-AAA261F19 TaxID=1698275 RepID=A0A133VBA9_9EURY|nr:hypothetical protein AKJ45_00615 [candidate division MSBL1 archaeon SCGC-AAA261F19]
MTIKSLDKIFAPDSVAVVGATDRKGAMGRTLTINLVENYKGEVHLVNPNRDKVLGIRTLPNVKSISNGADLALIATPRHTVSQIVEECGRAEIPAIIIFSSGFSESGSEGKKLEKEIEKKRNEYGMRILGPNSMGVVRPCLNFNATLSDRMPEPGETAFISQSGALGPSLIDQQARAGAGLSGFVSVGNMLDVDFGDLIDYFGQDPETRTILMYIESIEDPKKFLSAAKGFAKTKPIILNKAGGKYPESSEVIASHIGSSPGEDSLYDALFKRAGVVRVDEISDLFFCSEALAHGRLPKGPSLAVITNAGGPGVVAIDTLLDRGGKLASFSDETVRKLKKDLKPYASTLNPIDILSDANADDYLKCVKTCLEDENVDGILVIYAPHGEFSSNRLAKGLASLSDKTRKTILACWMGEKATQKGRNILRRGGVPTLSSPEQAVKIFMYMYGYRGNKELLYETPKPLSADKMTLKHQLSQRDYIRAMIRKAVSEGRDALTEKESKGFLMTYGIPAVMPHVAKTPEKASDLAVELGFPVVLKVHSPDIVHKSDIGSVALNLESKTEVEEAFSKIMRCVKDQRPTAEIGGVVVQRMVENINCKLTLRSKKDPRFGSVVIFGRGGVDGEFYQDKAVGFPPMNYGHAKRLVESTKVPDFLERMGKSPAKLKPLMEYLARFSQLLIDHPEVQEADIDLASTEEGFIVMDASMMLDREVSPGEAELHKHLIEEPYPLKYIKKERLEDGREVKIRPIKPEDEPLILGLFDTFSKETWRRRFFGPIREITHDDMIRFANIDYSREIAFVGELIESEERKIIGIGRLIREIGEDSGEFAVAVGDPWQEIGLGTKLMESLIEFGRDKGLKRIWGTVQRNNFRMIHICRKLGFLIENQFLETIKLVLELY